MRDPIVDAVADVLNEHDAIAARARLAAAILDATAAEVATRVSIRRDRPEAVMRIHSRGHQPPAQLPDAADVRGHPLSRYRAATGDPAAVRLTDVMRAGFALDAVTAGIFDRLGVTPHQADLAMPTAGEYDSWTLVAPEAITLAQLRPLVEHAALLRGLDRHIELLAALQALLPVVAVADVALTPRELMVLRLMHAGCTAAAVGSRLGVSPRTVHKHQEHLYRKLGARDRLEAVLAGQRAGLLPTVAVREEAALVMSPAGQPAVQTARPATMPAPSVSKSASDR